jgi:hypothetical protein
MGERGSCMENERVLMKIWHSGERCHHDEEIPSPDRLIFAYKVATESNRIENERSMDSS